jgi:acyl-CoA synthetase (NDP forming)
VTQARHDLDAFFHPESVALIGRVDRRSSPERLERELAERWQVPVHLVNPRGGSIGHIPVYPRIGDVPGPVSLAVVSVAPELVPAVVDECGHKGVTHVLVFSAGFGETGPAGAALEAEVGAIAREHGMRVFGPNTNTNAFERLPDVPGRRGGRIGLITQSGHNGRPVVQGALFGVAFSRWVPTGNELDLEASDFIDYFAHDRETAVIAGYIEGFRDGVKLRRALGAANEAGKPVVLLKMGRTEAGRRMAASHTGHLTGSDRVVAGLFAQHGVTRVGDIDELLETSALFAKLPAGTGPKVCCYSISGGSSSLMAEIASQHGVVLPELTDATQSALHRLLPSYLSVRNPVDNGGAFVLQAGRAERRAVLDLILADPEVDILVAGLTGPQSGMADAFATDLCELAGTAVKPIVVTWNSWKTDEPGFDALVASGLPMFRSFRNCFVALRDFARYQEAAGRFRPRPPFPDGLEPGLAALLDRPGPLGATAAATLLGSYGVPVPGQAVATSAAEAADAASAIGFPVVAKVVSADVAHKSDAGLVRTDLRDAAQVVRAFGELTATAAGLRPLPRLDGVLVQQQVEGGVELIVGVTSDPILGPAVMVGAGGIYSEILEDVAVRPLPLDRDDVEEMIGSLRARPLLSGARGRPPADLDRLADVVLGVARLAAACGPRLAELDLNPVIATAHGAMAVDCLVVAAGARGHR